MSGRLADELRRIRAIRGHTLRAVETGTKISNAYLSQLERGEAANPSPHILHKLSKFYDVPYEMLMEFAGYIREEHNKREHIRDGDKKPKRKMSALETALMSANFTEEEEARIAEFIEFLRFEHKKQSKKK